MMTIIIITYLILVADDWYKIIRRGGDNYPNFLAIWRQLLIPFPESFRQRQVPLFNFGNPDDPNDHDTDEDDDDNNDDDANENMMVDE